LDDGHGKGRATERQGECVNQNGFLEHVIPYSLLSKPLL
jgi:hypothetical protein